MNSFPTLTQPAAYRIRIVGRVRNGWSDFMTGLQEVILQENGTSVTELTGTVPDKSALFGLLVHIRDLGVPLLSVEHISLQNERLKVQNPFTRCHSIDVLSIRTG